MQDARFREDVMIHKLAITAALAAAFFCSPVSAQEPLAIAKQGYFFVGGKYATVGDKQVMTGQIYVEYQIPRKRTQPYPLVIVPGAAQTATNFTGTTDGREGWTQYFLRRGYAVYIVEQPGRGRSSYQPDTEGRAGLSAGLVGAAALHRAGEVQSVAAGAPAHAMARHRPGRRCRRSTSSSRRRCRSCRSRRSSRRSTATPWWR